MSEHEFEKFLALLSGMLKLDAAQRDEIATELRDHLEDRLTELLTQGVPRDKAILIALEEFGDAAGLAAEFLHIVRHQRRRKIMRLTAGSLAAAVVMVLGVMAFWPESHPMSFPATSRAVAQATVAAPATPGEPTVEENNAATERKLAQRIPAELVDIPLRDVLESVFETIKVDTVIRTRKLGEANVSLDMPINLHLKQIRADMLLDLVLNDAGLAYSVRDGILFIDSADALEIRLYNVRDLVTVDPDEAAAAHRRLPLPMSGYRAASREMPAKGVPAGAGFGVSAGVSTARPPGGAAFGGSAGLPGAGGTPSGPPSTTPQRSPTVPVPASDGKSVEDFETLIHVLTTVIDKDSWSEVGGEATVAVFHDGLIVVYQTPRVHRKISSLLEKLCEARGNHASPQVPAKVKL